MRISSSASVLTIALALVSCGYGPQGPGDDTLTGSPGRAAFAKTVYAVARERCIGCHGSVQNPRFAQDDLEAAYRAALPMANFAKPSESTFVVRVTNGHCGVHCMTDGTEMTKLIEAWWEQGQKEEEAPPVQEGVTLYAQPLPAPADGFAKMEWRLPDGERFELEVSRVSDTLVRFRKPRLTATERAIFVRHPKVLLNGHLDPAADVFAPVDVTVRPGKAPILSAETGLALTAGGEIQISISFRSLAATEERPCKASELFKSEVLPLMQAACFRCHQKVGTASAQRFFMSNDPLELCSDAFSRLHPTDLRASPLIAYPLVQKNDHPARVLEDKHLAAFRIWLAGERRSRWSKIERKP